MRITQALPHSLRGELVDDEGRPAGEPAVGGRAMWLEMKVKGLALDPLSNMPMIILRDEEDKRSLPIWVGLSEANAIAHRAREDPHRAADDPRPHQEHPRVAAARACSRSW